MANPATLTYKDADGIERVCEIPQGVFRIGRLAQNNLSFDNRYISRFHTEVVFDGVSYSIFDLGSTSGTFVNGDRVSQAVLKDGDRIRLGRMRGIEFVFHTPESSNYLSEDAPSGAKGLGVEVQDDVHVIAPEDAPLVNTARLPDTADLADETIEQLRMLYEFTSELLTVQSSDQLSHILSSFLLRTFKSERAAVLLYDEERDTLKLIRTVASDGKAEVSPSRSIARRVFQENVAVLSRDASRDERFSSRDSIKLQSIRSAMGAPIGSKSRVWGVSYVDNLKAGRAFSEDQLEFLTAVGRQAGLMLENLYLIEEQQYMIESFIRSLAASIDARDDSTAGHMARVAAYSTNIARTMGLSPAECRMIYYAGLLHDYGKIGVRDDVLLKPDSLTPEEYEHVKEHPLHTYRILSKIRFPKEYEDIPRVAASHHERWDGEGYPYGLKGEEIPIGSRIVAVADAYDAMAEQRVYSDAVTPAEAFERIKEAAGTFFCPAAVNAFAKYYEQEIEPRNTLRIKSRGNKK
ncbi:MAG TPA: HD domain-containing phosphohydrolase [Blastocatellia bacterium]|nr:HD domain-containing phosphohydrolase [Blastocatellia bacterium]